MLILIIIFHCSSIKNPGLGPLNRLTNCSLQSVVQITRSKSAGAQ